MSDFRKFSEKYSFRERSETPDIAIELSLQPWKRFDMDGVIMFSGMKFYLCTKFGNCGDCIQIY